MWKVNAQCTNQPSRNNIIVLLVTSLFTFSGLLRDTKLKMWFWISKWKLIKFQFPDIPFWSLAGKKHRIPYMGIQIHLSYLHTQYLHYTLYSQLPCLCFQLHSNLPTTSFSSTHQNSSRRCLKGSLVSFLLPEVQWVVIFRLIKYSQFLVILYLHGIHWANYNLCGS